MANSFRILVVNDFKTEFRSWRRLILETVIVVIFVAIIVVNSLANTIYKEMDDATANQTLIYSIDGVKDLSHFANLINMESTALNYSLAYTPDESFGKEIVTSVVKELNLEAAISFETPSYLETMFDKRKMLAGIEFPHVEEGDVPKSLTVRLRFPSAFRTIKTPIAEENLWIMRCNGFLTPNENDEDTTQNLDLYLREGFLTLQNMIFLKWYRMLKRNIPTSYELPHIYASSFRYHNDYLTCEPSGTSNLTSFLYCFVFMMPFLNLLWRYGREREENMLVHHWKYGCRYCTYWLAHFIVSFIHLFLLDIIIVILLKIPWTDSEISGIFRDISSTNLLLFLVLYSIGMLVFVMVVVAFIVDAKNSVLVGIVLWLVTYALLTQTMNHTQKLKSPLVIASLVLFFNSSFTYGMNYLKNIREESDQNDIWILFGSMMGNIVVELCLLAMVQYYRPGLLMEENSFNICHLFCNRKNSAAKQRSNNTISLLERTPSWHNFEFGPYEGVEYIRMKNVCTWIKRNPRLQFLKNISMRFCKGEVTVILGPICAGKTTLVRVLGGLKKPDTGWVQVAGKDIYENWKQSMSNIDVCMPSNTLHDLLTAAETLQYHIRIKESNITPHRLQIEVQKWLQLTKPIISSGSILVKKMNFGQKRLLCLCCTFAGGTKIALLDEPTLHLRRDETRLFWSILQREKLDRAIVMTTISVDEAEAIGDRIALLNNGTLKAYGTQFFLKNKYSVGYDLIILKEPKAPTAPITEFLCKFIANITPVNEVGDELVYKIPSQKRPIYQRILIYLEKESNLLGIKNIRMVGAELSEAYMTIDQRKNSQILVDKSKYNAIMHTLAPFSILKHYANQEGNEGVASVREQSIATQQFFALMYKKCLYQAPNIIPLIMIAATVLLIIFIGELTKDFVAPSIHRNSIYIGFKESTTNRSDILGGLTDCTFVEINYVDREKLFVKINSRLFVFTNQSLKCRNETAGEYFRKTTTYKQYGGVEMIAKRFTSWNNQRIFHSAPLALNLLHNIILNKAYPDNDSVMFKIVNNPMPMSLRTRNTLLDHQLSHLRAPLTIGIIIPIIVSCFILFLVEERQSHMLLLQKMAGVRMDIYWIVNFLWDWGTYLAYSVICILVMALTTIEGFGMYAIMRKLAFRTKLTMNAMQVQIPPTIVTLLLITVYGLAGLAMTYLISMFCHTSPLRSFLIAVIIQLLTGLCAYVFYWDVIQSNQIFFYIASFAPSFSLLDGISNIYTESKALEYCRATCNQFKGCSFDSLCDFMPQCCDETFFKWHNPGILLSLLYMLISFFIFGLVIFVVELHHKEKRFLAPNNINEFHSVYYSNDDKDVINIKKYIANADMKECRQHCFVVDQLENRIPAGSKELKTISFALDKSVCLSIFGAQNVGKTHLMKQFVGEHGFSFGDVYVKNAEVKYDLATAYKNMSYCSQDGGYFRLFTPRELLRIFCLIRGMKQKEITIRIRGISLSLNMRKYMNKAIGELRYEKRRKVAIALALVAQKDVILLDEPTRGLPASTRREIWNVLRFERVCEKTIIFTSTETMECEALADQVILFNDGEMLAIGSVQHLRQKFTKGFYLEIKLKRDGSTIEEAYKNFHKDVDNLNRFIYYLHEDAELRSRVESLLKYYLPVENVKYSFLFGALEKNRRRLNILDYTVSQGTMQDIMLNMAEKRQPH